MRYQMLFDVVRGCAMVCNFSSLCHGSKILSGQPSHPKPEGLMLKNLPLPPGMTAMHMELLKSKVEDIIKHLLPGYSHTYLTSVS